MSAQPLLETSRLLLRPFTLNDAPEVRRMAGTPEVAATTLTIPHPYPEGAAEAWISQHPKWWAEREVASYAITDRASSALLGCISLTLNPRHRRAEIGYWVGKEHWGRGFCSEAAVRLVRFGFGELALDRIHGHCLVSNPASARVMEKAGMQLEGVLRRHILKNGLLHDIAVYGVIR